MNRSALRCGIFAMAISVATGLLVRACSNLDLTESLGEKTEWSILQGIEYQERGKLLAEPSIRTIDQSEVMGVRGQADVNVWLLLKVQSPPYYKQIPEGNYEISSSLLDQLEREHRVSYTVAHAVRTET